MISVLFADDAIFTFVTCNVGLNTTEPCCFWRTCLCTFFSSFFIVGPAMQVSYVLPPVLETEHRRHVHDYHLHERVRRHWRLFHGIVTCSHAVPGLLLGVSCVHSQNCPMDQKTQKKYSVINSLIYLNKYLFAFYSLFLFPSTHVQM